jgi:hypothetical protein
MGSFCNADDGRPSPTADAARDRSEPEPKRPEQRTELRGQQHAGTCTRLNMASTVARRSLGNSSSVMVL